MKVVYTHVCSGCDWQPDPNARAGTETQIERHQAATHHSVTTHGRPEGTDMTDLTEAKAPAFDATDVTQVRMELDLITYDERYEFLVREQRAADVQGQAVRAAQNLVGIELAVRRPDAITGKPGLGYGGVRWLSPHTSRSDLVRMAFGAILAYREHEAREFFRYRGRQVFGPHIDVDALWEAAAHSDYKERG